MSSATQIFPLIAHWCPLGPRFFSQKLGRCAKCIRLSLLSTIISWSSFATLNALFPNSLLDIAAAVIAVGFTGLSASHLVALFVRTTRKLHIPEHPACCGEGKAEFSSKRRSFLASSLKMTLAAFLLAVLPKVGWAQDTCTGRGQAWGKGAQTETILMCAKDCQEIREKLHRTQQGAYEFCVDKSTSFCLQWNCDQENQGCRVVSGVAWGHAAVHVKSCKKLQQQCPHPPYPEGTFVHEVVLAVRGGGGADDRVVCTCGCVQI